jgi:hypothetical protein
MLSVILLGYDAGADQLRRERIVRSLASLVDATVQGVIADAVLAGPTNLGLEIIADEAGCGFVEQDALAQGLGAALACVRQADVFILTAGHAVERGFVDEARDALVFGGLQRARILRAEPDSLATRLAPALARTVGLLARKNELVQAGAGELGALARRLRGSDLAARARKCC